MNGAPSPLEIAKERLRIPELWELRGWPGKPGTSCRFPDGSGRNRVKSVTESVHLIPASKFLIYSGGQKYRTTMSYCFLSKFSAATHLIFLPVLLLHLHSCVVYKNIMIKFHCTAQFLQKQTFKKNMTLCPGQNYRTTCKISMFSWIFHT